MRTADPDPAHLTRRSYDLIAEDYDARNTGGLPAEFAEWADAWVADVLADAPVGLAPAAGGAGGGAAYVDEPAAGGAGGGAASVDEPAPAVLDAGAGPGHLAARFRAAGLRAVALDLSDAMVALARGRRVPVVRGDLRRLPFGDGAFDGVWSSASLLHVPREDVPATLREWRRVTAPGGHLALSTASGGTDGWEDPPYDTRGERPPPRWFVYHDEPALRSMLEGAGWSVESVGVRESRRTWLQVRARAARG